MALIPRPVTPTEQLLIRVFSLCVQTLCINSLPESHNGTDVAIIWWQFSIPKPCRPFIVSILTICKVQSKPDYLLSHGSSPDRLRHPSVTTKQPLRMGRHTDVPLLHPYSHASPLIAQQTIFVEVFFS